MRYGDIIGTAGGGRRGAPSARRSSHSFPPATSAARDGHYRAGNSITAGDQTARGTPRHQGGAARPEPGAATEGRHRDLINLTYISECLIAADEVAAEIELILADASERNARREVTGALLFTGACFVQTLEGTAASIDGLMTSIARDARHTALFVIDRHDIDERAFAGWSLTYAGPSRFIAKVVAQALAGFHAGVPADVARLLKVMIEFGAPLPFRPAP